VTNWGPAPSSLKNKIFLSSYSIRMSLRLTELGPSLKPRFKMVARFETADGKVISTHFGASGYGDYPTYYKEDPEMAAAKKAAYLARHVVREDWTDPTSAGALSRWVLWNMSTVRSSIADYKRRFGLSSRFS